MDLVLFAEMFTNRAKLFLLLCSIFAVYFPAIEGRMLWDDDNHVLAVYDINDFEGSIRLWTEPGVVNQYYPLTYTSFWLENKVWNLNPPLDIT